LVLDFLPAVIRFRKERMLSVESSSRLLSSNS
jgi:hypothetical protein